jgi:hypothetical protein
MQTFFINFLRPFKNIHLLRLTLGSVAGPGLLVSMCQRSLSVEEYIETMTLQLSPVIRLGAVVGNTYSVTKSMSLVKQQLGAGEKE